MILASFEGNKVFCSTTDLPKHKGGEIVIYFLLRKIVKLSFYNFPCFIYDFRSVERANYRKNQFILTLLKQPVLLVLFFALPPPTRCLSFSMAISYL